MFFRIKSYLFFAVFLLWSCSLKASPLQIAVKAEAAILMNADTGAILYEKNAHDLYYPASTTKIATALYTLKLLGNRLDVTLIAEQDSIGSVSETAKQRSNYTLPSHWLVHDASHMGIKKGEELSLEVLLYGMMLSSADDASNVIANYVGGTIGNFMSSLNAYLKEMGCKNTHFLNPHGLHHPKHQTTAYDLAKMTQEALKIELFRTIVSTLRVKRPKTNKQEATTLVQTNKLLKKGKFYYPYAIGVKTGYTSKAQNTFVAAATKEGRTLIAVLLKVRDRDDLFIDAKRLFQEAFDQPKVKKTLLKAGEQSLVFPLKGGAKAVKPFLLKDVTLEYYPAETPDLKCYLVWDDLTAPLQKGQKIGAYHLETKEGKLLEIAPLFSKEDVPLSFWYRLKQIQWKSWGKKGGILAFFLIGMILLFKRFIKR